MCIFSSFFVYAKLLNLAMQELLTRFFVLFAYVKTVFAITECVDNNAYLEDRKLGAQLVRVNLQLISIPKRKQCLKMKKRPIHKKCIYANYRQISVNLNRPYSESSSSEATSRGKLLSISHLASIYKHCYPPVPCG